jgi:uncharacterized protein (TIGR03067 family)
MRTVMAVIAVGLLMAAGPEQDAVKKELAQLEGEWTMVSGEINGQAMPEQYVKTGKRVAKDGVTTIEIGGRLFFRAKYTIDATKKPKAIDYQFTEGPTKGKTQLGIYELDGDTAKFCFASPGKERPTDFTAAADSGRTLSTWKRVKK